MRARFVSCLSAIVAGPVAVAVAGCGDRPPANSSSSLAMGTGGGDGASSADQQQGSPACGKPPGRSGVFTLSVPIAGKPRAYTLVVPAGYSSASSYPLIYVLHGHGGSGAQARASFDLERLANGRALFLYPEGHGGWDLDSPASKNADVGLFDATLAVTQSAYCIDLHRVFVTGFSNGAYMANQLACRRGDRIRAIASHAGGGPYEATGGAYDEQGHLQCNGKPVSALIVHGTSDGTVAPSEGQKSLDHWTHANHCSGGTAPIQPPGCVAMTGCTGNGVATCRVPGLGHTLWPQGRQLTWSFFDSQR